MNNTLNKDILLKLLILISVILFFTPLCIAILTIWAKPLNFIEYQSSVWIGFWGSYLGGVIGTVGVIYVAHLQDKSQREENEKMMATQRGLNKKQIQSQIISMQEVEKNNRDRLKIETQLKIYERYIESLKIAQNDVLIMRKGLYELVGFADLVEFLENNLDKKTIPGNKTLIDKKEKYSETKELFLKFSEGYFLTLFEDIFNNNLVLAHEKLYSKNPNFNFPGELDKITHAINSRLKELDIHKLKEDYMDSEGNFTAAEDAWRWVRDEKANAYINMKNLLDELE